MNARMVRGLIGDLNFTDILNVLPIEFLNWPQTVQEALWLAVLGKINDGVVDIRELSKFARQWVSLYPIVKSSIHRAISKSIL